MNKMIYALAKALVKAIEGTLALPQEIHVGNHRLKECLLPVTDSFGITVSVAAKLPALDQARMQLLRFLEQL